MTEHKPDFPKIEDGALSHEGSVMNVAHLLFLPCAIKMKPFLLIL